MATYQAGLHHHLRRILAGDFYTAFDILWLLSRTVVQIPSLVLRSLRRVLKGSPTPESVKRPRPAGRRRRRFTPERSYPISTPPIHTTWQSAAAAHALLGTSSQVFLSSSKLPRNRFKSRQHARHWHHLQNSSTYGPLPAPPAPKQPRIDLHVKLLRGTLCSFPRFRQHFKYDAPENEDPAIDMQAHMEDIYENPVRIVDGDDVYKAPGYEQPTMVVHKMYWTGEEEKIPAALTEALNKLLTNLSITHCRISLHDYISILHMSPVLDSLEVRDIGSNEAGADSSFIDYILEDPLESKVSSLTATSFVPLSEVFDMVQFVSLSSISLRLHGDAKNTIFDALKIQLARLERPRFRLRAGVEFSSAQMSLLQETMESSGVVCDFAHSA